MPGCHVLGFYASWKSFARVQCNKVSFFMFRDLIDGEERALRKPSLLSTSQVTPSLLRPSLLRPSQVRPSLVKTESVNDRVC